jgi:hypothetical protein
MRAAGEVQDRGRDAGGGGEGDDDTSAADPQRLISSAAFRIS